MSAGPLTLAAIAALLAPHLGGERSVEVVEQTARQLQLAGRLLDVAEATRILSTLAASPGIAGFSARFALGRMFQPAPPPRAAREPAPSTTPTPGVLRAVPAKTPPPGTMRTVPVPAARPTGAAFDAERLAALFENAVGAEKAKTTVLEALERLALPTKGLTADQALLVLDTIAIFPGIIGVTARFARVRIMLPARVA